MLLILMVIVQLIIQLIALLVRGGGGESDQFGRNFATWVTILKARAIFYGKYG